MDVLPPTSDAAHLHIKRAHLQALVWRQSTIQNQVLPSPKAYGWEILDDDLVPTFTINPKLPEKALAIVKCGCTKGGCITLTQRCSCRLANIPCTSGCKCTSSSNCTNMT